MLDVTELRPGDLFVLPDKRGLWGDVYEYVGRDNGNAKRIIGRALNGSGTYAVRIDAALRPAVVSDAGDEVPTPNKASTGTDESSGSLGDSPLTADQRRMIFGLGRSRGFDVDDLRALTPMGSISALTRSEAGKLIDGLAGKAGWFASRCGPQGTATAKQLGLISHLRDQIGFDDETAFNNWLKRQWKVGSLDEIDNGDLASRVIGGAMAMLRNQTSRSRASGAGT